MRLQPLLKIHDFLFLAFVVRFCCFKHKKQHKVTNSVTSPKQTTEQISDELTESEPKQ